jgi:hypothetical protein
MDQRTKQLVTTLKQSIENNTKLKALETSDARKHLYQESIDLCKRQIREIKARGVKWD